MTEEIITIGAIGNRNDYLFEACDGMDYALAVLSGILAGVIDVFFVGTPKDTKLGKIADDFTEKAVIKLAELDGWHAGEGKSEIASAIAHFEGKAHVNYEQISAKGTGENFSMRACNHHFKNLDHCPDLIGLFFSVLDQFTMKATFISDGRVIRIDTLDKENPLKGGDSFVAKVFCGVCNWFFHIISDIAGSTGYSKNSKRSKRGAGVAIPGMELFNLCDFGAFRTSSSGHDSTITLAQAMVRVYENGYDFRFGLAMSVPVLLQDMIVRVLWIIRARFGKKRAWNDCIPNARHGDLRVMLLVGNTTLCVIDGVDAAVRSSGLLTKFILRMNYVAWMRLIKLVMRELAIRTGRSLEEMSETLKRINDDLSVYLEQLRQIDLEAYEEAVLELTRFERRLECTDDDHELTELLYEEMETYGITLPFRNHRQFDAFMEDESTKLVL